MSPGRSCPLHYRLQPERLREGPVQRVDSLYLAGGLYGNWAALKAILALRVQEQLAGRPRPALVFNGDFNWFNAEPACFEVVNAVVLDHLALRGNVETELAMPSRDAGCGCAYPDWVGQEVVSRSNAIMARLQRLAADRPRLADRLGALPTHLNLEVGGLRVLALHGDPESLAGWGLALEAMPPPGEASPPIADWFSRTGARILACSHTCLPFMQDWLLDGRRHLVANNGAAGMPNFRGDRRGLVTRIGIRPSPFATLYGTRLDGVYVEALPVQWEPGWDAWFAAHWPPGSPAWESYRERFMVGPRHGLTQARRLAPA